MNPVWPGLVRAGRRATGWLRPSQRRRGTWRPAWRRTGHTPLRPPAVDTAIALGLAAIFSEPGFNVYHHESGSWWAAGGLAATLPLAWRRSRPGLVWLMATAVTALLLATRRGGDWNGLSPLVMLPSPLLALYTVAERGPRRLGQNALTGAAVLLLIGLLLQPVRPEAVATTSALLVTGWALGENTRSRRAGIAAVRDRAAALESERAERDRRAAADERSRIARDLHDIVAHHVSVITLQAGTARLLAESGRPPEAALLAGIETAGRQAMTELREALGVIRHAPDGASPLPGLAQVPQLAARFTASGLDVLVTGSAGPLSGPADLAAYRIVQEGLTNVLRHSAAHTARVVLGHDQATAVICVRDDGPARDGSGASGYGLIGLRERAAALGGSVSAGPGPDGGYQLRAELPLPAGG